MGPGAGVLILRLDPFVPVESWLSVRLLSPRSPGALSSLGLGIQTR